MALSPATQRAVESLKAQFKPLIGVRQSAIMLRELTHFSIDSLLLFPGIVELKAKDMLVVAKGRAKKFLSRNILAENTNF